MEDYEIAELRLRRRHLPPLISFEVLDHRKFFVVFDVANIGDLPAEDVKFEFPTDIAWPTGGGMPQPFRDGIRRLAPRQRLRFRYFAFSQILGEGSSVPPHFSVRISYFHPEVGGRVADEWFFDFAAYRDSMSVRSETEQQMGDIVEGIKKLTDQIDKLRKALEPMEEMTAPTGLRLSVSTIRNLKRALHDGSGPEPFDPIGCAPSVFQEVLGVDGRMAAHLYKALSPGIDLDRLASTPGMTDELLARIRERFRVNESGSGGE
jgi:hypothetical protein